MACAVIPDKEMRRINAIRYLAKANPVKYKAAYRKGRLELDRNIAWRESTRHGQMYMWMEVNT